MTYTTTQDYAVITVCSFGSLANYCSCTSTTGTIVAIGSGGSESGTNNIYMRCWAITNVTANSTIRVGHPNVGSACRSTLYGATFA